MNIPPLFNGVAPVSLDEFVISCGTKLDRVKPGYIATLYNKYVVCWHEVAAGTRVRPKSFSEMLGISKCSANNYQFYIDRGWDCDEAKTQVSQRQATSSLEALMSRGHSEDEARAIQAASAKKGQATSIAKEGALAYQHRKRTTLKRNQLKLAKQWQQQNRDTVNADMSDSDLLEMFILHRNRKQLAEYQEGVRSGILTHPPSTTMLEYYTSKGATIEEAIDLQRSRQTTFSLSKCISMLGEVEGHKRWQQRQDRWQATMDGKTDDEKFIINQKRAANKFVSRESVEFFLPIAELCDVEGLIYHTGKEEWFIRSGNHIKFYDFTIPSINLIVEYHGTHVHPKEDSPENWIHPFTREDKAARLAHDASKRNLAESAGFDVIEVWSDESWEDSQQYIKQEIKHRITKQ